MQELVLAQPDRVAEGKAAQDEAQAFAREEFERQLTACGPLAYRVNGQPIIRQFRTSENLILKDGQTSENIMSTDPLNGHTLRVSVTINVLK